MILLGLMSDSNIFGYDKMKSARQLILTFLRPRREFESKYLHPMLFYFGQRS